MADLVYKELSYEIVGVLYEVYKELGGGYQEKYYQRAINLKLKKKNFRFREQICIGIKIENENIGKYFLDFLIEDKIILEIKAAPKFYARDIKQVLGYLQSTNLNLGILASFGRNGLFYKRILKGKIK
ncbi:GxxExxY protein [Patescibacteria group bacterium]|nr:GxxExxY protein [Patescibacteria group bacterium]MBU4141839.1 GxxExxY protein [Patescibacteria group bacterium]MBU4338753.1 GxxExxY protein [Patescibacteria group bacterium]MBU4579972.1 GxxExxY protein [Patescibacteria group bacterium]